MILKNSYGQALVEFVIILPIFIFMIFAVIDLGKILYIENNLESKMDDVITIYENNKNQESIKEKLKLDKEKIDLEITTEQEYLNILLEKKIEIITPGLNLILGSPYKAQVKRVIYNE